MGVLGETSDAVDRLRKNEKRDAIALFGGATSDCGFGEVEVAEGYDDAEPGEVVHAVRVHCGDDFAPGVDGDESEVTPVRNQVVRILKGGHEVAVELEVVGKHELEKA